MPRITGRPPKPTELKRRLGNPGGRKLPAPIIALAPVVVIDSPGIKSGTELVEALLASPASAWIAEPDRLALLEMVRSLWDERLGLRDAVANLPADWVGGRYLPPALARLDKVEARILECLSMLGLSPSDRTRLGVAEVKARSKLEELREKRARLVGPRVG